MALIRPCADLRNNYNQSCVMQLMNQYILQKMDIMI